jgi:antitoxin (DNA-binding transcriptional repressor) of toxin-antitoxin stability system
MEHRVVSATEFKAKCLSLLDDMENNAATITITRRGKPVAILSPPPNAGWKTLRGALAKKVRVRGDIVSDLADLWDVDQQAE